MASIMNLVLIADEEKIVEENVKNLVINTEESGQTTILPNHIPFLSKISDILSFETTSAKKIEKRFTRGFVYTNGQVCFVVVDELME